MAAVVPCVPYAYTWLRGISHNKHVNNAGASAESSKDPQVLLAEANRLLWLFNGPRAAPLYAEAESLFAQRGDARNELYAKIGGLDQKLRRCPSSISHSFWATS